MIEHIPVMLNEVLQFLDPQDNKVYFDGTFGGGGYTQAILNKSDCSVIACDRDEHVFPYADKVKKKYGDKFHFSHSKFSEIKKVINKFSYSSIDGIVLDLGVSNFQLADASRGFSFKSAGSIDMSMGLCHENAFDLIRRCTEEQLANIIYEFGEERFSRRIAKRIKENLKQLKTTEDLANVIRACVRKQGKIDPATKTFQALRIYVNNELNELRAVLQESVNLLNPGGRIVVVSFHSLEDRIVKLFFREISTTNPKFKIVTKKPIVPTENEIAINPKSRSAKLRCLKNEA